MSDVKTKRVNIYIDQTAANAALVTLQASADKLNARIAAMQATGKSAVTELKRLDEVNAKIKGVQDQLDKGLAPSLVQQTNLVRQLRNEISHFIGSAEDLKKLTANYQQQNTLLQQMKTNVDGVKKSHEELNGQLGRITEWIAEYASLAFIFEKVKEFLTESVQEANRAEIAYAQLQNILNNIGRDDVFDRLKEKAQEFADKFKIIKSEDVVDVFQKLITYGKLTENQITDLTEVIINFASKQRIDVAEATNTLTTALEGNYRALRTYGINVKDANTVTERFGILMDELKPKVEGAAEAFGDTTAGQIKKTEVEIEELQKQIGEDLQPAVKEFYAVIRDAINGLGIMFNNVKGFFSNLVDSFVLNFKIMKAYITDGTSGAIGVYAEAQAKADDLKKKQQQAADEENAHQVAQSIARDAATKSIAEQNKLLQSNIALQQQSVIAYQELIKAGKENTDEGRKAYLQLLQDSHVVGALQEQIKSKTDTRILGNGDPNTDPKGANAAAALAQKIAEARKQFEDFVKELDDDASKANAGAFFKQVLAVLQDTEKELEKLQELKEKAKLTDEEVANAQDKIYAKQNIELKKLYDAQEIAITKIHPALTFAPIPIDKIEKDIAAAQKRIHDDQDAKLQIDLLNAQTPEQRKNALLAILKFQHDEELKNKALTDEQRLLLETKYQDKVKEIERNAVLDRVTMYIDYASQIADVFDKINQAAASRENAALQTEIAATNAKKTALQKSLDAKLITQTQYNTQVIALDNQLDAKKMAIEKKQFERQQRLQIVQALISGAQAVVKTIAEYGPPVPGNFLSIAGIILDGVITAAQVAAIASAKPAFAGGGKVTHRGNIPTQPNGDNILATVRTGEVVLNEQQQRALGGANTFRAIGVPGFGSGGYVPAYQTRAYAPLNYGAINKSLQVLKYAAGGLVTGNSSFATPGTTVDVTAALQDSNAINLQLMQTISALHERLNNPIETFMTLNTLNTASDLQNRILKGGTFK